MSIDMSQFHQVFFEESLEGLDIMEKHLLAIDPASIDLEEINTIFRAAHSIKGGAGTFGFMQISDFTHVVETLLDEVRAGNRGLSPEDVNLLLQSVDCLRGMLDALQAESEPDMTQAAGLSGRLEAALGVTGEGSPDTAGNAAAEQSEPVAWRVEFRPEPHILRTGNEPLRLFRELGELGELQVRADTSGLPDIENLVTEDCYLSWTIELRAEKPLPRARIEEVFEWVIDDCELSITPLEAEPVEAPPQSAPGESSPASESATGQPETAAAPPQTPTREKEPKAASKESASIRVGIDKIDALINMVGELVITQSMLGQLGQDFDMSRLDRLQEGLAQLEQNTRELQERVMSIRMVPISFAFSRFPRLVRDMSQQLGKKIDLVLEGETTELDKTVMEKIGDPLVHLVRNSLDHGIEMPAVRKANGKPENGTITLAAYHQGGNIVIDIIDDGGGLNTEKIREKALQKGLIKSTDNLTREQVHDLVFRPGFSTADKISDISGRGVGMDVVRRNIQSLNGTVKVTSEEDQGSVFSISLPLTLAILDGQLIRCGVETYIVPLVSIVESIQVDMELVSRVAGSYEVFRLRDEYVPIIRLYDVFNIEPGSRRLEDSLMVVVEHGDEKVGLVVDELLGQQQVVIKSLEDNYQPVAGISGATILGDGTVALILDIKGLIDMAGLRQFSSQKHLFQGKDEERAA